MLKIHLLLAQERLVPVVQLLRRFVKALARAVSSTTFVFIVSVPFVAWALSLMWIEARFPDDVARAVAHGPSVLLSVWAVFVAVWIVLFQVGFGRHVQSAWLAILVLVLIALQTAPRAQRAVRSMDMPARTSQGGR